MITEHDLDEAIAECKGKRKPDANDCIKLAAFLTIKEQLYPGGQQMQSFSYSPPPTVAAETVDYQSDSEFAGAVDGKRQNEVWPVMDELMDTLAVINPRLYDAVMRKLR